MKPSKIDLEWDRQLGDAFDAQIAMLCEQLDLEQINPKAQHQLRGILKHYAKEAHPFNACMRDNLKRFGPGRAQKVCATIKDTIWGTTHWRGKHNPAGIGPHPYTGLSEGAALAGHADVELDADGYVLMSEEVAAFIEALSEHDLYELLDLAERDAVEMLMSDFSAAQLRNYAKKGIAMPDGSYPIPDVGYLHKAIEAVGRGTKNPHAEIRAHIKKRAKALNAENMIPKSWS